MGCSVAKGLDGTWTCLGTPHPLSGAPRGDAISSEGQVGMSASTARCCRGLLSVALPVSLRDCPQPLPPRPRSTSQEWNSD